MNHVRIGTKPFTGPAGWDELRPRQYRQVMNWRVRLESDPAGRFALLRLFYGIGYRQLRLLTGEQRLALTDLLDFLDTRPDRWMLPRVRIGIGIYVGPGDGLELLSFAEFMRAEAARGRYLESEERTDLAALAAALYRPRALPGQAYTEGRRRPFDDRHYAAQCRRFERLPDAVLQGILFNYQGCLDPYPTQFTHLFGGAKNQAGNDDHTWLDVGLSLARQTSALGSFTQLEGQNLFIVLTTLEAMMKEAAELKANTPQS